MRYSVKKLNTNLGLCDSIFETDDLLEARHWTCSNITESYHPVTLQVIPDPCSGVLFQFNFDYRGSSFIFSIVENSESSESAVERAWRECHGDDSFMSDC